MPRPAKLWKRAGRDGWWATIDRRKVQLGTDRAEAEKEFHRRKAATRPVHASRESVAVLVDRMLECVHSDVKASTFETYRWYLQQWVNFAGTRPAAGLKPLDVTAWFRTRPQWNPSTRRLATEMIRRWSRWCKAQGYLDSDVLSGARGPKPVARKAADPRAIEAFLAAVTCPLLRDIATVLLDTGARPGEIRTLTAENLDWTSSMATVNGKTGPRTISLTERSLKILRRLSEIYPSGPLLRNRDGDIWTRTQLAWRFRAVSKRANVYVFPYHLRHSWWAKARKAGVDSIVAAAQLGHKDLKMLLKVYAHVEPEMLKEAVERAAGSG